jgi:2,4-dienoyl-CoA reductase-like NADH-dependent reductase (Old Yellow Enzyme family)
MSGHSSTPIPRLFASRRRETCSQAAGAGAADNAEAMLQSGDADLAAFGRHFIANPDLPERLRKHLPLNPYDHPAFFGGTEVSYTDSPGYRETAINPARRLAPSRNASVAHHAFHRTRFFFRL